MCSGAIASSPVATSVLRRAVFDGCSILHVVVSCRKLPPFHAHTVSVSRVSRARARPAVAVSFHPAIHSRFSKPLFHLACQHAHGSRLRRLRDRPWPRLVCGAGGVRQQDRRSDGTPARAACESSHPSTHGSIQPSSVDGDTLDPSPAIDVIQPVRRSSASRGFPPPIPSFCGFPLL